MSATEQIVVNSSEEFAAALARVNARGQRISAMARGKTNSAWVLTIGDAPLKQPELGIVNGTSLPPATFMDASAAA